MRATLLRATAMTVILLCFCLLLAAGHDSAQQSATQTQVYPLYDIVEHRLPAGSSQPWTITNDSSGNIWFTEQGSNQIGMYQPATQAFSEYDIPTPKALPQGIAVDSGGNVWFAEVQTNRLGELPHGSGTPVEYGLPKSQVGLPCGPIGVTARPGGQVWVTCEFSNEIEELIPSTQGIPSISTFELPVPYSAPLQILFDSKGNFWFTAADSGMLGYATTSELMNGTSDGIQEFPPINETYKVTIQNPLLPSGSVTSSLAIPSQIAFSSDGNSLWITEHGAGTFDRYDIASKSLIKYWTSRPQDSSYPQSLPNGVAVDSRGVVWIAEHYGNKIARFDPTTEVLSEYAIPCCKGISASALYLTLGEGGRVWFTEFNGNALGELVPAQHGDGPTLALSPQGITMSTSDMKTVSVMTSLLAPSPGASLVNLTVAGITPKGSLQNITANFAANPSTVPPGGSGTGNLTLVSKGLRPGVYYLTVSARVIGENVTEGVVLKLTVIGYEDQFRAALLAGLYVGAAASAAVVGVLILRRSRRNLRARKRIAP